jgi:hypothetical protein
MKTGIVFVGVRTLALMHGDVKIMKQYNIFKVYIASFDYTVMIYIASFDYMGHYFLIPNLDIYPVISTPPSDSIDNHRCFRFLPLFLTFLLLVFTNAGFLLNK